MARWGPDRKDKIMKSMHLKKRTISFALAVVLSMLAVDAVAGDEIRGLVDGLVAGFTDNV